MLLQIIRDRTVYGELYKNSLALIGERCYYMLFLCTIKLIHAFNIPKSLEKCKEVCKNYY